MHKFLIIIILIALLAIVALPALAQDDDPVTLPDVSGEVDQYNIDLGFFVDKAGAVLMAASLAIAAGLKAVFPKQQFPAKWITFGVWVILALVYMASTAAGVTDRILAGFDWFDTVWPNVWSILLMVFGSTGLYKLAKYLGVPVLGESQGEGWFNRKTETEKLAERINS